MKATQTKRLVVHIDPERCNGCGECVPSCAEGAIQVIDGKARLVADNLCDGLGACLGHCPQDAIRLEEREAEAFDEAAVHQHLGRLGGHPAAPTHPARGHACPGAATSVPAARPAAAPAPTTDCCPGTGPQPAGAARPGLRNWPVQLHLLNPRAPYFQGASLLVAADCAAYALPGFHQQLAGDRVIAIGCPKLDDAAAYVDKIADILRHNQVRDITVALMEVPCCGGLGRIVQLAQAAAGTKVPVRTVTVTRDGHLQV